MNLNESMSRPKTILHGFHDENAIKQMKYCDFGKTGLKVSKLSLGTGGFSDLYGSFTLEQCKQTVLGALKSGINYIDTAPWYGQGVSETTLGKCLIGIPRQTYYIATKVGRYEKDPKKMFDFSAEKTRQSIDTSLKILNLDYVDVIQIHDIEFAPSVDYLIKETLSVLIEAKKQGKVKFIGVTGYQLNTLAELVEKSSDIDMVLSYSRLTLFDEGLLNYKNNFSNIAVVNSAVLAMGLLTENGPQPWHPAQDFIKDACKKAAQVCKDKNVDIAKLALSYCFNHSFGDTVLSGMNTPELLKSSLDALYNGLNEHEMRVLHKIQQEIFSKLPKTNWEGIEIEKYQLLIQQ